MITSKPTQEQTPVAVRAEGLGRERTPCLEGLASQARAAAAVFTQSPQTWFPRLPAALSETCNRRVTNQERCYAEPAKG